MVITFLRITFLRDRLCSDDTVVALTACKWPLLHWAGRPSKLAVTAAHRHRRDVEEGANADANGHDSKQLAQQYSLSRARSQKARSLRLTVLS